MGPKKKFFFFFFLEIFTGRFVGIPASTTKGHGYLCGHGSPVPSPCRPSVSATDGMRHESLSILLIYTAKVQQRQQILEFVASCNGFGDTHEDRRYEIVERGLKQALHLLTQLAKVWMVKESTC